MEDKQQKDRLKNKLKILLLIFITVCFNQNWQKLNFSLAVSVYVENKNVIETENLILSPVDSWPCEDSARNTLAHILLSYESDQLKLLDLNERLTVEDALKFIDYYDEQVKKHECYVIQTKNIMTLPIIGGILVDFYQIPCSDKQSVSLKIFVDTEVQKQGIATEALSKLVDELIELKDVDKINCCCLVENKAFKRLIEKVFKKQELKRFNLKCEFKERVNEEHHIKLFEAALKKKNYQKLGLYYFGLDYLI